MIQEGNQPRLEQLFAPQGNGALSYFYASNKIIANPSAILDILRDFPQLPPLQQQKLLVELSCILQQVTTNAYCLNQLQQPTVIQLLIDLIPAYVDNYLIFNKFLSILQQLFKLCSLDQRLLERALKKLTTDFYTQQGKHMETKLLFAVISIIKIFYNCKIAMDKQPDKMLVFHGGNGLQIRTIAKKQINWIFGNGVSVYFWINIENIKFGTETSLPKLFTFYSPNNGGLQCYLIDNKIYYRTVGSKYNSPKIGSNGICLGQLQPKKWNFIGIQQQGPKRIIGRSHIIFRLNDKKTLFNLSPPTINSKQKMQIVFFDKIYCKTSSICIFPYYIQNDFIEQLNKNKNSIDLLKNNKAFIFQQRQNKLYQKNQFGYCPDTILHRYKQMNFQHILPLFHLYKYTQSSASQYPILNQLLSLFVLFLYKSSSNQTEASQKNYPHIISQLIKSLPNINDKFNEQTINTLLHIKQTITNPDLLIQYHSELLWNFIDSKISINNKQVLLQVIKNNFTQNISYFSNIIGLDQMINTIIKLNHKVNKCCQKHYKIIITRFEQDNINYQSNNQIVFGQNQIALDYILKIIQLYIQNQKVNSAQQIYKLCRMLSLKFSPCFMLSFMSLIKKILNQKFNQKLNNNQGKKIIQYLINKKIYLIFLYVIENTFFAQIKAQSAKIIYSLLLRRTSSAQQQQISYRLSNVLWKINEDRQPQSQFTSKQNSPVKHHSIQQNKSFQKQQTDNNQLQQNLAQLTKKASKNANNLLKINSSSDQQSKTQSQNPKNKAASIFKQVGPQAPQLTNKSKGQKTFSFNFMSQHLDIHHHHSNKIPIQYGSAKQIGCQKLIQEFQQLPSQNKNKIHFTIANPLTNQAMQQQKTNQHQFWQLQNQSPQQFQFKTLLKLDQSKKSQQSIQLQKQKQHQLLNQKKKKKILDQISIPMPSTKCIPLVDKMVNKLLSHNNSILSMICVSAMKGKKYHIQSQMQLQNQPQQQPIFHQKNKFSPLTTTNKLVKARQQLKLQQLKLIDEQSQPQSAIKSPLNLNMKYINTSIQSPHLQPKKSKSPTNITTINQENLIVLYNSLMQNCITLPNYQLLIPSIMYIFFSWIPKTNLQVKFLLDLSLILDNDQNKDKIKLLTKMPQLYDFLFELTYKALVYEQVGQKRLYIQKLQQIIKKVYAYIFRQQPQIMDKLSFITDWSLTKIREYNPKCLLLSTRFIFFLLLDAIEQDLFTNSNNDKIMQKNFQYLGIIINKFCKFIPVDHSAIADTAIYIDQYDRVMFSETFQMLPSLAPYFTSQWMDYLICQRYYILFKKFFCTDWYNKNLKSFQNFVNNGTLPALQNLIINTLPIQALVLNAQYQYYMKNSFIFTIIDINRMLFIQKCLNNQKIYKDNQQMIWQTILLLLFAQSNKQRNAKNNSQFIITFLKNCKIFCILSIEKAAIIIHVLKCIKDAISQNSALNPSPSADQKQPKLSQLQPKSSSFIQHLIQNYINKKLFQGQTTPDFQTFKLNFQDVWIPGQNHQIKIKSQMYVKYSTRIHQMESKTTEYLEELSNIMEEQTERSLYTDILIQAANRQARNTFTKVWKNLRIFGSPWTHSDFTLQNDTLFNKNLFTYQRYQQNKFYKLRICKHMSKYRLRYLLKPVMSIQSPVSPQTLDKLLDKQQIGLNKALLYYNQNKLILGWRIMSWLFPKQSISNTINLTTNTFRQLEIIMPFKNVRLIKTLTTRHGYLGIINDKLLFTYAYYKEPPSHLAIAEYKLKPDKSFCKLWPLQWIKELFTRRYINRKRAIEISFIHGKSIMFEFYENDHQDFIKKIIKLKTSKCPNLIYNGNKLLDSKKIYQSQNLYKKWSTYQITNFQYLMEINNLSGRSYCDLTQYPVVPWILVKFGNKFDITDENNYRNFLLPMGALGSQNRTKGFKQRYENMGEIQGNRFHYGTHYSNPGIIYHFLVRISPFTQGNILLQSGKFDFADRLFFSLMQSYKNATSQYSDVRQLLPQMYTIPQVYLNINKWNLGIMQNQKRVHNVQLPPWSRQNPYLFVSKLRKSFQQLYVSKNINKWIDLIFGYKQRGQQAVKNLNCFVHVTYQDSVKFQQYKDQKSIKAIQTQILNFGQTPSQLFTKPHPQRTLPGTLQIPGTICDPNIQPRIYRPSRHTGTVDAVKDIDKQQFNIIKQSGQSIIHMRWFKQSRLVFIRRNGQMQFYKWHSGQSGINRVPFQCAIQKQKQIARLSTKTIQQNTEYFDPSLKLDTFPIQFINNGHHIALGGFIDGKLLVIDVDTNAIIQSIIHHNHTICCIKSDLNDNFLITGDIYGHVIVWRIINGYKLSFYNQMKDHSQQITSIFISYDLRCVFTSSMDGRVYGYNIITNRKMKIFFHPKLLPINNIIVSTSPLSIIILFCNVQSIIYCYSINGQLIQRVHQKQIQHFLSPILVKDTLGFEHVVYGSEHGQTIFRMLPFLDNATKHVVAKQAAVNQVCLSKSSKFVIVGCSDGQLSVMTAPDQPSSQGSK